MNEFLQRWIEEEATALAIGMSFKNKVAGLPLGGGKGAILLAKWEHNGTDWTLVPINGGTFERKDLAIILRDVGRAFAEDGVIDETIDGAAPDVNPFKHQVGTDRLMAWLVDETLEYLMEEQPEYNLWKTNPQLFRELQAAENDLIDTHLLDVVSLPGQIHRRRNGHGCRSPDW